MHKIKYHSNLGSVNMLPKLLNKKINICSFVNGHVDTIHSHDNDCEIIVQGNKFVLGFCDYGIKTTTGKVIEIRTTRKNLSYDINTVDEKIISYKTFSIPTEYHVSVIKRLYENTTPTNINVFQKTLIKCIFYGYDIKKVIPEFPDEPDSEQYDIDLKFIHSVVLIFKENLVLVLDIDCIDSINNFMHLHIQNYDNYEKRFVQERFQIRDDWGYLRYNKLFSFGED